MPKTTKQTILAIALVLGALGQAGEPWQIEVPLSQFKPKTKHLPGSPAGMELTDIWVVSREENAELEIHSVKFLPREEGQ